MKYPKWQFSPGDAAHWPLGAKPEPAEFTLRDRYTRRSGPILLSGVQALVRLLVVQRERDRAAGLNTAGFVSGYRGSPLAGFDAELWRCGDILSSADVAFAPGVNEELAATAVWGSQQAAQGPGARVSGVFGMWYGKAPGVDRAGDALKHANYAGAARGGGALVVAGDDHACKSSTLPSQSEPAFVHFGMPVLNPADVQEVLDFGIYGWALSRATGLWVGMVALADTMDSSATVDGEIWRVAPVVPEDVESPPEGFHIGSGASPLRLEEILYGYRLPAAAAFARANRLDRITHACGRPRLGVVTTGKAHLDLVQAFEDLGLDRRERERLGIAVYKVGMSWPLERKGIRGFADGLEELLVVEEKRGFVEGQVREHLYDLPASRRPRVVGKFDDNRRPLLPATADLSPAAVARALVSRLDAGRLPVTVRRRMKEIEEATVAGRRAGFAAARTPFYCAGCPHSRSTTVIEGSRALAGIGCHYMAQGMDRRTDSVSQMGGEGVAWIGQAPFTDEDHVFVNLGDGTYFHSGSLAIRAAVSAGVNVTYKILFNDAVAMTGGQPVDGTLSVPMLTRQLVSEGVAKVVVVADDTSRYANVRDLALGTAVHERNELDRVSTELRDTPGCTVLIYDQTCAAEQRRRRKRGQAEDPPVRVLINEDVCEGCGDCSKASSCVAVSPVRTELGEKRAIDQTACNKDLSCLDGQCPAFVTVEAAQPLPGSAALRDEVEREAERLEEPSIRRWTGQWNVLVAGVGGTGIVTTGALLTTAAHLDGRGATSLDMTGLSQKNGAVYSHVRLSESPLHRRTPRIPMAETDVLLAVDPIAGAAEIALARLGGERTHAVVAEHAAPTAAFVESGVSAWGSDEISLISAHARSVQRFDAHRICSLLFGDTVQANVAVLGFAYQLGLVPVSLASLQRAIELNGAASQSNRIAFSAGRLAASGAAVTSRIADSGALSDGAAASQTLEEFVARRREDLLAYQGAGLADRYMRGVERAVQSQKRAGVSDDRFAWAVARSYFKVLAYKDEYEVARLYTDGRFESRVAETFGSSTRFKVMLAPPLWSRTDPVTGRPVKRPFGRLGFAAMRLLARLKFLRGTRLDPFGYTFERRLERRMIADFERDLAKLHEALSDANYDLAVEIAELPQSVRGFGSVKIDAWMRSGDKRAALLARLDAASPKHAESGIAA